MAGQLQVAHLEVCGQIQPVTGLGVPGEASVGALFGRLYRLGLLIQCVEEGLSILQFVCKPHPCLGKIGEMLS